MTDMENAGLLPLDDRKAGIISRFRQAGCRAMADCLEQICTAPLYSSADFDTKMELMIRAHEGQLRENRKKNASPVLGTSALP